MGAPEELAPTGLRIAFKAAEMEQVLGLFRKGDLSLWKAARIRWGLPGRGDPVCVSTYDPTNRGLKGSIVESLERST